MAYYDAMEALLIAIVKEAEGRCIQIDERELANVSYTDKLVIIKDRHLKQIRLEVVNYNEGYDHDK